MELTQENAKKIIQSRQLVTKPGYHSLRVTSVTPFDGKNIISLAGMTPYQLEQAKELFMAGEYNSATNKHLSANARPQDYLPTKGEVLKVFVDFVEVKGGDKALLVTSYAPMPVEVSSKVVLDFADFGDEDAPLTLSTAPAEAEKATA